MKDVVVFVDEASHIDIEALTKPAVLLGAPVIGRSFYTAGAGKSLPAGTHSGRIMAIDLAKGEDCMAGIMARIALSGHILIEHIWQIDSSMKIKVHKHSDMYDFPRGAILTRSQHNRHHKRKPQPNRGPQGGNQW